MDILIIHLTDIHMRDEGDFDILSTRINSIGGAICNHITEPEETSILLCVTGDFAFSGNEDQYTAVGMILEEICLVINERFPKVGIHPVFVPENHDSDFEAEEEAVRAPLLSSPALDITNSVQLKMCTSIQKSFYQFGKEWNEKYGAMYCDADKILTVNILNFQQKDVRILFHCINTSWCSKRSEEKGKMKISTGKMKMAKESLEKNPNDIVITMMHHDAEWLDWEDKEVWNEYHKTYSDIVLVGHDHTVEYTLKQNYDETSNYFVKGNQLYDKKTPNQSGFNILKLKTSEKIIQECFITYEWDVEGAVYRKIIHTDYKPFVKNRFLSSGIELKKEVWEFLEDLDIDIINANKGELKLSDVFGFPTLKEEKGKVTRFYRDMQSLISRIEEAKFISIRGQKEYGKTSLLKQIFKTFYENGKFPVFLDISKINTADGEALNKIVENRYLETYDNIQVDEIMQKHADERVCFIDNFEELRVTDGVAKKILQYLTVKFGYVIMSRNHTLDIINPLKYVDMNDFIKNTFNILMIQPTRRSSKERIIDRWLLLTNEGQDVNSPVFDAMRREKYTQIQSVMKNNYFNQTPIDLLLVLSYLDQEHPTQIDYSRYSYIYANIILQKLMAIANNDTNTISMYKTILQRLAYKMYRENKADYVSEDYVMSVVFDYKEHHSNVKLKAADVVEKLVEFKFLDCKNDTYRFKSSYIYYFFVGSHVESKLSPNEKAEVVKEVFENINKDINYNVALFLAFNMNIEHEIIPLVTEIQNNYLAKYKDFDYDNIQNLIREWNGDIEKKVEKIYSVPDNSEIPELRRKKMEELEEYEEVSSDEDKTDREVSETNSAVIKIVRLIDFMGSVLKNYSGEMENEPREIFIDLMFNSSTKVIGAMCGFSMYMVDNIITMLEEKIKEDEDNAIGIKSKFVEAIKQTFGEVIYQFVSANVLGLAVSLDCDILKENIDAYCTTHNNEFVKMVRAEYLIRISSTRLPVDEISKLYKNKDGLGKISQGIFRDNVYRYLTNYQYDSKDRETICSILGFDSKALLIQEQKAIAARKK